MLSVSLWVFFTITSSPTPWGRKLLNSELAQTDLAVICVLCPINKLVIVTISLSSMSCSSKSIKPKEEAVGASILQWDVQTVGGQQAVVGAWDTAMSRTETSPCP